MPPAPHKDDERHAPGPVGKATLTVMLVVASQARHKLVLDLIGHLAEHSVIETTGGLLEAMLRSYRKPADLLVLDLAVEGPAAPALIRQLARIAPALAVLVFDDIPQPRPSYAYDVWPWSETGVVLQRWLAAHAARSVPPAQQAQHGSAELPPADKTKDDE